jgi:hypothetical protein
MAHVLLSRGTRAAVGVSADKVADRPLDVGDPRRVAAQPRFGAVDAGPRRGDEAERLEAVAVLNGVDPDLLQLPILEAVREPHDLDVRVVVALAPNAAGAECAAFSVGRTGSVGPTTAFP